MAIAIGLVATRHCEERPVGGLEPLRRADVIGDDAYKVFGQELVWAELSADGGAQP
jgi:hypothetical protein